jgi:hypothetical protein
MIICGSIIEKIIIEPLRCLLEFHRHFVMTGCSHLFYVLSFKNNAVFDEDSSLLGCDTLLINWLGVYVE